MKKLIYLGLSLFLVLLSLSFLLLYYTQDFKEDVSITKEVNLDDVKLVTSGDYLSFVEANIGNLTLENKGYFSEMYSFPKLILCVGEGGNSKKFETLFIEDGGAIFRAEQKLEIPIGEKRKFEIYAGAGSDGGRYYSYSNYMTSDFPETMLGSSKIFLIAAKESNPIGSGSYASTWQSQDCSYLTSNAKAFANITVIS